MTSIRPPVTSSVVYSLAGLHVVVVRLEPGAEVPRHSHEHKDEVFDVAYGSGMLDVEGERVEAGAGALAVVPRSTVHGLRNTGSEPWIIRETARERLYTRGNLLTFLGPRRLISQTQAILFCPCRPFPCVEDLPVDRLGGRSAADAQEPGETLPEDPCNGVEAKRKVPCVLRRLPLPIPPHAARELFSVSGLSGSVVVVPAGRTLMLGAEGLDDVIYDPVRGGGWFVWGSRQSRLTPGTVAMLPAGHEATIASDANRDLILRVTRRLRPSQLEIARMVARAIARRLNGGG